MSLLDRLQLSFRCPADWEAMEGDETKRFCNHCQKNVHNLSAMRREEAEAVVSRGSEVCVRMVRRADGSTVTKGCPKSSEMRTKAVRAASAGLAAGGALVLASCGEKEEVGEVMVPAEEETVLILGEMEAPAVMGIMCPVEESD